MAAGSPATHVSLICHAGGFPIRLSETPINVDTVSAQEIENFFGGSSGKAKQFCENWSTNQNGTCAGRRRERSGRLLNKMTALIPSRNEHI